MVDPWNARPGAPSCIYSLGTFLGSLILFNHHVVEFLYLSPALIGEWTGASDKTFEIDRSLTISRLQITYFGLCFLGIASFLFAIICPSEIKRASSVSAYIEQEKPLATNARTSLLLDYVAHDYISNHGEMYFSRFAFLTEMAYTEEQIRLFCNTFKEIAEAINWSDDTVGDQVPPVSTESDSQANPSLESDPIFEMGLITMTGEYNIDKVAEIVYYKRRIDKFYWANFDIAARRSVTDLLSLRYLALDHSRPVATMVVAASYGLGFSILFYPTVWTFVRIIGLLV